MRRDTFTVPGSSHVVIRFMANNPGLWVLHCHVAWHLEGKYNLQIHFFSISSICERLLSSVLTSAWISGGMLVSFVERPDDLKTLVEAMDPEKKALSQSFCAQ